MEFLIILIDTAKPTISIWNLMTQNKKQNIYNYMQINKYTNNSSKGWVLKVDLEYLKELDKLHNDYPLALHKIEI